MFHIEQDFAMQKIGIPVCVTQINLNNFEMKYF